MISTIIIIVLLSLFAITLLVNQYLLHRTTKVGRFRLRLIDMAHTATQQAIRSGEYDVEKVYRLCDKYSYEDMLYSFKSLTLEAWYTEEEIKMLKGDEK